MSGKVNYHCINTSPYVSAVPGKPIGFRVNNIQGDNVTLYWSPPKRDGGSPITHYNVVVSSDDGKTWSPVETVPESVERYVVNNLKEDVPVQFRVSAINAVGEGEWVESDTATPKKQIGKGRLL